MRPGSSDAAGGPAAAAPGAAPGVDMAAVVGAEPASAGAASAPGADEVAAGQAVGAALMEAEAMAGVVEGAPRPEDMGLQPGTASDGAQIPTGPEALAYEHSAAPADGPPLLAVAADVPTAGPSDEALPSPAAHGPAHSAEPPADTGVAEAFYLASAADAGAAGSSLPSSVEGPDPAAALGIAELARLAARLGCSQSDILRAADIDASVVAELPEDMRSAVVMSTVSQVSLDHLRRPRSAPTGGELSGSGSGSGLPEPAPEGGGEIDAAVLEALPPEIREEVLREEEALRRERERAAQRAAADAGSRTAGVVAGEMDNASFIASLDPILREEVLMTAPEELLQSLPAELVAEAQLIRDRAFTRIAARREAPAQPQPQLQAARVASPTPGPQRPHHFLQAMEQQLLLQAPGSRRPWGTTPSPGRHSQGPPAGDDLLAQLGLHHHIRLAVGGQSQRQLIALGPHGQVAGGHGTSGLNSFEEMDRHLLERLSDFDDDAQAELPLPVTAIPAICRLLYLRQEVAVTPLTRLFFNLSLHPITRSCVLGHFLVLLCRRPEAGSAPDALPPPHLFEGLESGRAPQVSPIEIQAVGSQRVLALLAYLLRRIPQCGDFFAKQLQHEKWMDTLQASHWTDEERRKKSKGDALFADDVAVSELPGQYFVNLLLQLLTTKLFLSSSQHAMWLLSILHALLVPHKPTRHVLAEGPPGAGGPPSSSAAPPSEPAGGPPPEGGSMPRSSPPGPSTVEDMAAVSNQVDSEVPAPSHRAVSSSSGGHARPPAEQQSLQRWSRITKDMHAVLSQQSVLSLCHFLCQAGSGHGSSGEGDTFQMAGEILVALAASQTHLDMVRAELMRVLASLVTDIEAALARCEVTTAEPSTLETRLLRVVRTLAEVFREAARSRPEHDPQAEGLLEEARVDALWSALDSTLDRLDDTEVVATPAQRLLLSGVAPSAIRVEGSSGLSAATSATLSSNVQAAPPKPLLNRLLPLIEAFFALHDGTREAEQERCEGGVRPVQPAPEGMGARPEGQSVAVGASPMPSAPGAPGEAALGKHVFAEVTEVSAVERSRFGQFCLRHRRPLNALVKQTPALLAKSFSPLLRHMPGCLDFDNKRSYFRSQLRSRRLESRYETMRLRVRRSEIFMDSYHQLRMRTGEEMRAKIQVQFQGEEGIDAGGVAKEWYSALAKEIFNPNYALFIQAGGKACTYHPNPMSYVNRDHLQFFQFIGRVIGKAIHDGQNLEAWFTRGFYKHMLGRRVIPADLEAFDPEYFSNLKWMLDHDITNIVELTYSAESDELGQVKIVDLKPNGRNLPVTNENKYEYIQLMSEHKMTNSVRQQIDAFLKGLHEIVPAELLGLFDDKELELLISGLPDIDIEDLRANTEYHNYTPQSEQVQWFWKVLSEFSQEQRAWFLQFATGTSRVPVEGFKGLIGMRGPQKFSVHRAFGADRLPSAHTCFNQLDLPDYPSEEVLREKLLQAVREGHEGFGFA